MDSIINKPCGCWAQYKEATELTHTRELARKMAVSERRMYKVLRRFDGSHGFAPANCNELNDEIIVEYVHYL